MAVTPQMTFEVPHVGAIIRKAMPRVIEGSVIPTALFTLALHLSGRPAAIVSALIWVYTVVFALRLFRHRNVPGLLVMSPSTLTARSAAALISGSTIAYFLQPTIGAVVVASVFIASVFSGKPLAARLSARLPAGFTRDL